MLSFVPNTDNAPSRTDVHNNKNAGIGEQKQDSLLDNNMLDRERLQSNNS